MTRILGGSDEIALNESREPDMDLPAGRIVVKDEETLLLTTEDMSVSARIPPKERKKETRDVTMAR